MEIPQKVLEFIKKEEGFSEKPYLIDNDDNYTIGYGTRAVYPSTNKKVLKTDIITKEQAEIEVDCYYCKYILPYLKQCPFPLNEDQIMAICSRRYNSGSFFKSKCWNHIKNQNVELACKEWDFWKYVPDNCKKGVKNRCNREIEMFYGIKNYWK